MMRDLTYHEARFVADACDDIKRVAEARGILITPQNFEAISDAIATAIVNSTEIA